MKFLQIGAGKWGSNHYRIIKELGESIEQIDVEVNPLSSILEYRPDAVIITTSSVNHFNLVMLCDRQNIPVFCEKPVCVKESHIEQLSKVKVPFMSGHQLVFMPEIESFSGRCNYMFSERSGAIPRDEGALLSLAVHDIAIAHYLFKKDSFNVIADGNKHNAKIYLSNQSGCNLAEILVQSFTNIRLRNLTMIDGTTSTLTIAPDNWNRIDLLKLELKEFIDVVKNNRYDNKNNLQFTLNVMKTAFKAYNQIKE